MKKKRRFLNAAVEVCGTCESEGNVNAAMKLIQILKFLIANDKISYHNFWNQQLERSFINAGN